MAGQPSQRLDQSSSHLTDVDFYSLVDKEPHLKSLNLSYNYLKSLGDVPMQWEDKDYLLEELYLSVNGLTTLPDLSPFGHLHTLHVNNNKLEKITKAMGLQTLGHLQILNLRGNRITEIEPGALPCSLVSFSLSGSPIRHLPLPPSPQMQVLCLMATLIESDEALLAILQQAPQLVDLSLKYMDHISPLTGIVIAAIKACCPHLRRIDDLRV